MEIFVNMFLHFFFVILIHNKKNTSPGLPGEDEIFILHIQSVCYRQYNWCFYQV